MENAMKNKVMLMLLLIGVMAGIASAQALPCSNISIEIQNSPNPLPYRCTTANGEWTLTTDYKSVTVSYVSGSTVLNWQQPLNGNKQGLAYRGSKNGNSWAFGPVKFKLLDCPYCLIPGWVIEATGPFAVGEQ